MRDLIDATELRDHMAGAEPPVVVDIRWSLDGPPGLVEYEAGHIPGAHYVDMDAELAAPAGEGGRHPVPEVAVVEAALRRCGVDQDDWVVVYDGNTSVSAARGWWVFRDVGVRSVRVLDGGLEAWISAGGAIEIGSQEPGDGSFVATPERMPRLDADAAAWIGQQGILLDARTAERYRGESEPIDPVAGHIPGAVCAPTDGNLRSDGRFLDALDLRKRFEAMGIEDESIVGCYCGSGVTAAHQVLALTVAGFDATLYPGSWSEWIVDPDRPVATGDDNQ